MSNKTQALETVQTALDNLQEFTKQEFPVGTKINSRRGRGEAQFEIVGYPTPTSIELANSVLGQSKNDKIQILSLKCVTLTPQ